MCPTDLGLSLTHGAVLEPLLIFQTLSKEKMQTKNPPKLLREK